MLMRDELFFLIVCLINLLVSICYLLWGLVFYVPTKECGDRPDAYYDNRRSFVIRFTVMVLCPIIGPCFFLMGYLTYRIFFHQKADLSDVLFSKERVRQHLRADEENEKNIAPINETLAVGDTRSQRMLLMNVIQGDLENSIASIAFALDSNDSELSHYAASALQDVLNDFRVQTQIIHSSMEDEKEDETQFEEMLVDYIGLMLTKQVFTELEQKKYTEMLDEAGEKLYKKNPGHFTPQRYEALVSSWLDRDEYEKAEYWCGRLAEAYPEDLLAYKCRLKLYYKAKNPTKFFDLLEQLKGVNIPLDNETIEIIRVFR